MEEKDTSESGSIDINSETDSPPFSGGGSGGAGGGGVAPPPVVQMQPLPQSQPQLQLQPQGMSTAVVGGGSGELAKKKRGRPRKYDSDGNLRVPAYKLVSPKMPLVDLATPPLGFSISHSADYSNKSRGRGRPPGSGNWQLLASLGDLFVDTAGADFTPHVINVYTGEDVASKILSLFQKGPRGICVLSANGSVSNVTIRQPGSSGGILTYEGRFEILSLTGSFTISESGGIKSRNGGLSVSLAGPDGRVIGGGIAGTLVAASPIQCVVGSFMPDGYKMHKKKQHYEPRMVLPVQSNSDVLTARPNSQPSAGNNVGQFLPSHFPVDNHGNSINKVNPYSATWNDSEAVEQKPSPDINMSAPDE